MHQKHRHNHLYSNTNQPLLQIQWPEYRTASNRIKSPKLPKPNSLKGGRIQNIHLAVADIVVDIVVADKVVDMATDTAVAAAVVDMAAAVGVAEQ